MSMLEDLYSEDLIGDPETLDDGGNEETDGPLFLEDEANEQNDGDAENDFVSLTVPQSDNPVQPKKKRTVKNPQPKLNPERLKGARGISILENVFKDYKFCGKGYEKSDLDQVLKRLEHWAHRLFPKYQFDDCLEKIETLGHKKTVMVYVNKIRMGLETAESSVIEPYSEAIEDDLALPLDPFDELLSQQLSEVHASQHTSMSPQNLVTQTSTSSSPQPPRIVLTEEQRERMERNRLVAQERRLARLKAMEESKVEHETSPSSDIAGISMVTEGQNHRTSEYEDQQTSVIENERKLSLEENALLPQGEGVIETVPLMNISNSETVSESVTHDCDE